MFYWVQSTPLEKKLSKVLTFLNPLIKFVTLLKEILKCPECQISWKLEHILILGPNLPGYIILDQDHQFQVLYSQLACSICSKCQIS